MNVFVVTDGDGQLCAIFSTREKAAAYSHNEAGDYTIEEWTLDDTRGMSVMPSSTVCIRLIDGAIVRASTDYYLEDKPVDTTISEPYSGEGLRHLLLRVYARGTVNDVSKIAEEARQKFLNDPSHVFTP